MFKLAEIFVFFLTASAFHMPEIRSGFACRAKHCKICVKYKSYVYLSQIPESGRLALKSQNKYNWHKAETENGHEIFDGSFDF